LHQERVLTQKSFKPSIFTEAINLTDSLSDRDSLIHFFQSNLSTKFLALFFTVSCQLENSLSQKFRVCEFCRLKFSPLLVKVSALGNILIKLSWEAVCVLRPLVLR